AAVLRDDRGSQRSGRATRCVIGWRAAAVLRDGRGSQRLDAMLQRVARRGSGRPPRRPRIATRKPGWRPKRKRVGQRPSSATAEDRNALLLEAGYVQRA